MADTPEPKLAPPPPRKNKALRAYLVLAVLYVVGGATFLGFGSWVWLMRRHPASACEQNGNKGQPEG